VHRDFLITLYFFPDIIRVIRSRRMSFEGQVIRLGEKRNACRILVGKPVDRLILKKVSRE
jgi:hypothetical protein